MPSAPPHYYTMNAEAILRRNPTEPALHTRPAQTSGTARRRQGSTSTPPPRRVPFEPPPRGWAPGCEPPEVTPPEPVQDKGAYFTEIAMHINEAAADLCRKFEVFASSRWHPQHKIEAAFLRQR